MKPFLFSLFIIVVFIICVSMATRLEKIEENKKEGSLVSDKMSPKDEKQKISDEDFINFLKGLRNEEKIYVTSHGTILNSKPHTFKDFINNQKLPSRLELIQEILADNNIKVKNIIQKIEDNGPYPPDTLVHLESNTLTVTSKQIKMINAIHFDDGNLLPIDNNYPLYIKFDVLNTYTDVLYVTYQAGYEGYHNNDKNLDHGHPTKPTKY